MRELTEAEYKEAQDYERSAFVVPLEQFLSVEKELNEARVLLSEKTIQYEITQEELEFVKRIRCDAITIETDRLAEEFKRNTLPDDVKLDILFGFTRKLEHALDELQEKYDTLAVENMLEVNMICKQRDAAMDVLEEISLYLSSGIGDENTTAQQYKERILDGIKHLAGHAWEERCKYKKLLDQAEEALCHRTFLENTHESRIN